MNIRYEDEDYVFELDEIDISQATTIHRKYGLTLLGLEAGLRDGNPDALRSVFWLMLMQNGKTVNIDNVTFKIVKFAHAIQAATEAEAEAEKEAGPKKAA